MRTTIRTMGIVALCGLLVLGGCATNVRHEAPTPPPPASAAREASPGGDSATVPRWAWITGAAVVAAAGVALVLAYVILPGIAESAAPSPSGGANGDGNDGGLL